MKTQITKLQTPKKSQAPKPNTSGNVGALEFELWRFFGAWSLVFGVCIAASGVSFFHLSGAGSLSKV